VNVELFKRKYGPWALVTGGSSGIGAEFARQLGALGLNIVLVARREDRMEKLAAELRQLNGVSTRVVLADLSDTEFISSIISATQDLEIGLLINVAGFALTGPLLDNPLDEELQLLNVNCRAPLLLSHHFGREMRERKRGGIIFLSSIVAFSAVPQWSNYAASKAYNLLLAEALGDELMNDGVDVLALTPGPTATEFQQVANISDFMVMKPEKVVAAAIGSLGNRRMVMPGFLNRYNNFWLRFFPRRLNRKIFAAVINYVRLK